MPTFREALATFRAKAVAGEIVNRKTGNPGPFAVSRIAPILSNVTAAVRRAAATQHNGRQLGEAELLEFDLDPYWTVLPQFAFDDAVAEGRSDPGKERANVRLFTSAVTGRDIEHERQPVVPERVPARFRPLYDAVVAAHARGELKTGAMRAYKRGVLKTAELLLTQGIAGPERMPHDPEVFHGWGAKLGWPRKDTAYCLTAYRTAADLAGEKHLPRSYALVDVNGLGIKSLPDYPERLEAAGYDGDARSVTPTEAVRRLAPQLGDALAQVIADGRARGMSKAWAKARESMASWVVATGLRGGLPFDVTEITWLDLWIERRDVGVTMNAVKAAQHAKYLGKSAAADAQLEQRSLMRLVLDASAGRSYANSPLRLANPAYERDPVPVYTEKLQRHLESAWMVTFEFFGTTMQAKAPTLWAQARSEYEGLQRHIAEYNQPRVLEGRKKKDKLPITWPQMLCMGLPYLAKQCYAIRGEIRDRLARVGHLDSRDSQRILSRYDEALRDYVVVALLTDDGLRIKNYAGAMAGEQIIPTFRHTKDGEVVGIERVTTKWSGVDHENVRLKVSRKQNETNVRSRSVTAAFCDLTLFFDYWTQTRPRTLAAAGLLPTVEAYNPLDDSWAAFPVGRPTAEQIAGYHAERAAYEQATHLVSAGGDMSESMRPTWRGNISEDSLSNVFGAAMHRICVEVLARELPAYGPALAEEWRGIFAGHITRTEIACYLGGVRNDWVRAQWLTNDSEATLRGYYAKLQATFDEVANRQDWERPDWFDAVIDRALERHPTDDWASFWRTFDPMRPQEALRRLVEPRSEARPGGRSRVRARP